MRTQAELYEGCGKILRDLRVKNNLSVNKITEILGVNYRTWMKYENGESAPTVPDFMQYFSILGSSALRTILDYVYPDIYMGLNKNVSTDEIRRSVAQFVTEVAPDIIVRELAFLFFAEHGSNMYPLMQKFTMEGHLPMNMKVVAGNIILQLWEIAEAEGHLVATESVMPDVDSYINALEKGKHAVIEGKDSYTTL